MIDSYLLAWRLILALAVAGFAAFTVYLLIDLVFGNEETKRDYDSFD